VFCSSCGAQNPDDVVSCSKCGQPQAGPAAPAVPKKFQGTMLMMNQQAPGMPSAPPAPSPEAPNESARPGAKLKGTMVGVAPPSFGASEPAGPGPDPFAATAAPTPGQLAPYAPPPGAAWGGQAPDQQAWGAPPAQAPDQQAWGAPAAPAPDQQAWGAPPPPAPAPDQQAWGAAPQAC
jgi:zinc-ribbon domain